MKASVGIVIFKYKNGDKKILVGKSNQKDARYMKLSFPGGAVDPGERFDIAAEREVYEETGIIANVRKGNYLAFENQNNIRFYFLDYKKGKRNPNEEFKELYIMSIDELLLHEDLYEQNRKILEYIKKNNLL